MFELAGVGYQAGVGIAVEAFGDVHVWFQRVDQITQMQFPGIPRQADATTSALAGLDISQLCKPMHHLDQMVTRNAIVVGDFLDAGKPVCAGRQIHQATQSVIGKAG